MPWVRLDDAWLDHPKHVAAGIDGRALWLSGLTYACGQLTGGHLPAECLPLLAVKAGIDVAQANAVCLRLLELNLWEHAFGGWTIHDFAPYQPDPDQIAALKEKRRQAGKKGGRASAQRRARAQPSAEASAEALAQARSKQVSTPSPSPSPSPSLRGLSGVQSTSSVLSVGSKNDDDGRVRDVCDEIGKRRHERARAAGDVRRNVTRHLATCVTNARTDYARDVDRLLDTGLSPEQVIAELDPDPTPPGEAPALDWSDYRGNGKAR